MSVLAIISLALGALQSVLPFVTKNTAIEKVISEAVAALTNVMSNQSNDPVTLAELENLRSKKLW